MARISPVVVSVAAWMAGAVTAVTVGLIALSVIGVGLTDGPIRSLTNNPPSDSVTERPAAPATPAPSGAPASSRPTPTPTGDVASDRTVTSRGGNVVARCRASGAYLVGWSPAPGYRAEDVDRGPAPVARLRFTGHDSELKISVRCVDGVVQSSIEEEGRDDD